MEQGNELSSCQYEVKRSITYQNGKTEEWATGDIGTYIDFYHATMNLTEYIIIEKKDNVESIRIEAIERIDTSEGEKREKIGEWKILLP